LRTVRIAREELSGDRGGDDDRGSIRSKQLWVDREADHAVAERRDDEHVLVTHGLRAVNSEPRPRIEHRHLENVPPDRTSVAGYLMREIRRSAMCSGHHPAVMSTGHRTRS
jgi:hypothetical protein